MIGVTVAENFFNSALLSDAMESCMVPRISLCDFTLPLR